MTVREALEALIRAAEEEFKLTVSDACRIYERYDGKRLERLIVRDTADYYEVRFESEEVDVR